MREASDKYQPMTSTTDQLGTPRIPSFSSTTWQEDLAPERGIPDNSPVRQRHALGYTSLWSFPEPGWKYAVSLWCDHCCGSGRDYRYDYDRSYTPCVFATLELVTPIPKSKCFRLLERRFQSRNVFASWNADSKVDMF